MGFKDREIELKLQVMTPVSLTYVKNLIYDLYGDRCVKVIVGHSKDVYFSPLKGMKADFIRVRYGIGTDRSQVTLKHCDRGSNKNRIEIDVDVLSPKQAEALLTQALGQPKGEIRKKFHVFFLSKHDNVSVYQVDDDPRVFVEVEATTWKKVQRIRKFLNAHLGFDLQVVDKSLYQLFLGKKVRRQKKAA